MPRTRHTLGAAGALLAAASSANAIIAPYGTMKKPDNGHVAWFGGGSAVPIGENLLLTAKHVGGKKGMTVKFGGGGAYKVTGVVNHPKADLALISVAGTMPDWHDIAPANKGEQIVLGGTGVTGDKTKVKNGKKKKITVFEWTNKRQEQWAKNKVDGFKSGMLTFDLDKKKKGVKHEAIVTPGDSGSGVFTYAKDGSLELSAITVAVSVAAPNTEAAMFGTIGYAVHLAPHLRFIAGGAADLGATLGGFPTGAAIPAPGAAAFVMAAPLRLRRRRG